MNSTLSWTLHKPCLADKVHINQPSLQWSHIQYCYIEKSQSKRSWNTGSILIKCRWAILSVPGDVESDSCSNEITVKNWNKIKSMLKIAAASVVLHFSKSASTSDLILLLLYDSLVICRYFRNAALNLSSPRVSRLVTWQRLKAG